MPTIAGSSSYDPPLSTLDGSASMAPGSRYRQQNVPAHTPSPKPEARSRSKEKGKARATHLNNLSIESTQSTPAEHDAQTNSYFLPVPSNNINDDITPTAASMNLTPNSGKSPLSPPRPPARSPLRHSQNLSPRPQLSKLPSDLPASSANTSQPRASPPLQQQQNDFTLPIPRTGKDNSDAARARRREAYKSGMSFVSLYELYSANDIPPVPVPPVPAIDKSKLDIGRGGRARSGSTASVGGSRERKSSLAGASTSVASTATAPIHTTARSGSNGGSQSRTPNNRIPTGGDATQGIPLAAGTMSSSTTISINVTPMSSNPILTDPPPTSSGFNTPGMSKSKRQHVLFELLETERIYSSDMALIKAVHLPLALGLKIDFGPMGSTTNGATRLSAEQTDTGPSRSSAISTSTAGSAQSQSGSSGPGVGLSNPTDPPMSVDDAKVIFANIDELAEFAGRFTEFIQLALGSEIDGGEGPDKIGELFLQMLPIMQPFYETYITKHSASIARLTALTTESPTPAMLAFVETTKAIASTHSNSWDLNSLLIKPIQRFLKYPLLLDTLVMSTPDAHPDKKALIKAKEEMVKASKFVNEQTQKVEICRTILQRKPLKGLSAVFSSNTPNASQLKVKGSKSVFAVTKSKEPVNPAPGTPSPSVTPFDAAFDPIQLENRLVEHASGGASGLEELIKHLQSFETILPLYMRDVVNWVRSVRETLTRLEKWATAFERVIALDESPGIEALDAFRGVLTERLSPMLDGLETAVRTTLAPTLAKIQDTMKGPTLLLNTAASLRTVHNQLMNTPFHSKNNRPSPQMIEGSKTYLALMQQLRTDLPVYVRHLDKMFAFVILQVGKWQERWYREVGNAWGDLWKALEVGPGNRKEYRGRRQKEIAKRKQKNPDKPYPEPGESEDQRRGAYGCSGDETVAIWWDRWEEVQGTIAALGVPSGAALQGVRSLQGLIKTPNPAAVHFPVQAAEPSRNGSRGSKVIHEEEDERLPPGYYPTMPSMSRRSTKPSIQTYNSGSSNSQSMASPIQAHSINNMLPPVSPAAHRKEKPPLKIRNVSNPRASTNPSTPIDYEPSSSEIHSPVMLGGLRDWSIRERNSSQERVPLRKKSDPVQLKGRPNAPTASAFDVDTSINGSKTMPRGNSFRKRLSDNMWFGDSSSKSKEKAQGLEIDGDELEAAVATMHAREEREAELATMGPRMRVTSNGSGSLHRHVSNGSAREPFHRRRTSDATDGGAPIGSRPRHNLQPSASTRRQKPSLDIPRQVVSEYGRTLMPTLETVGHRVLGEDAPILFTCTAVAAFQPKNFRYRSLPFLQLEVGDIVNITRDAGRPSQHPELEPVVADGIDTLFIGTKLPDAGGEPEVGWLWASFVMPFEDS